MTLYALAPGVLQFYFGHNNTKFLEKICHTHTTTVYNSSILFSWFAALDSDLDSGIITET